MQESTLLTRATALLLLFLTAPLLGLFWLMIKLSNPKLPAFFKQTRVGLHGKTFSIWKMRTMDSTNYTKSVSSVEDVRITRVGRWLRRSHLDELLQLVNVINGTMTFIGPRPMGVGTHQKNSSDIPGWEIREKVLPGITGLYQVSSARNNRRAMVAYDRLLLQNLSCPWFRLWIVWCTICEMVCLRGK